VDCWLHLFLVRDSSFDKSLDRNLHEISEAFSHELTVVNDLERVVHKDSHDSGGRVSGGRERDTLGGTRKSLSSTELVTARKELTDGRGDGHG
jgi:hypothetical protein